MPHPVPIALVVRDYDEALAFYAVKLGFELIEDTYQPGRSAESRLPARRL